MKDSTKKLKEEAQSLIDQIKKIHPVGSRQYFCLMFPEYQNEDGKPSDRLNNLWYGNSTDMVFNVNLSLFITNKNLKQNA